MDKNNFFKAVSPIPMYKHMEFYSKFGRFWNFGFFRTPYHQPTSQKLNVYLHEPHYEQQQKSRIKQCKYVDHNYKKKSTTENLFQLM